MARRDYGAVYVMIASVGGLFGATSAGRRCARSRPTLSLSEPKMPQLGDGYLRRSRSAKVLPVCARPAFSKRVKAALVAGMVLVTIDVLVEKGIEKAQLVTHMVGDDTQNGEEVTSGAVERADVGNALDHDVERRASIREGRLAPTLWVAVKVPERISRAEGSW